MSRIKTHVKINDEVEVISGAHKGKRGKITEIKASKDQVVVEGVRPIKKAVRRSEENPEGGILDLDGPIHISNVKKVG